MNNTQEGRDTVSMPNIHSLDLHGVSASPSVVVAPSDVQGTIAATFATIRDGMAIHPIG